MYLFLIDLRVVTTEIWPQWESLQPELRRCGLLGDIQEFEDDIEGWKKATSTVKNKKWQTIVVVGDDASFATIASAVVKKKNIVLGYIPMGNRNDFAKMLNLPYQKDQVGHFLANRRLKSFDLMKIDTMYALQSLHIGYLQHYYHQQKKQSQSAWKKHLMKMPGIQRILQTTDFTITPVSLSLELASYEISINAYNFSILNTSWLQGQRIGSPDLIKPDDGKVNIIAVAHQVQKITHRQIFSQLENILQTPQQAVTHLILDSFDIQLHTQTSVLVDGWEITDLEKFHVEVIKHGYRLIT